MKVAAVKAAARDADRDERPHSGEGRLRDSMLFLSGVLEWSLLRRLCFQDFNV
jgi:hypothetical protein